MDLNLCVCYTIRFGPRQSKRSVEYSLTGRLLCDFKFAPFARRSGRTPRRQVCVYVRVRVWVGSFNVYCML